MEILVTVISGKKILIENTNLHTMSNLSSSTPDTETKETETTTTSTTEAKPSYVKLAMRNMVRKGATSLKHFALTTIALVGILVGLAYITR